VRRHRQRDHFADAWRIRQAAEGPMTIGAMEAQVGLADAWAALGRHDEALPIYRDWVERQATHHGAGPELAAALERQAAALESAGQAEEAATVRVRAAGLGVPSPPAAGE
jgi:hypothetical protein